MKTPIDGSIKWPLVIRANAVSIIVHIIENIL